MMSGCSFQGNTVENAAESVVQAETQTTGSNETSTGETQTTMNETSTEEVQTTGNEESEEGIAADDNFSVDMKDAVAFADAIKEAVMQKDLEALADMTAFPLYVNFRDGGKLIENREALIALGTDQIFTEGLVNSVSQSDEKKLSPSEAGFILTKENGAPNIVFGLRDGKLAVVTINY